MNYFLRPQISRIDTNRCGWDKNKKIREDSWDSWLKMKGAFCVGYNKDKASVVSAPVVGEAMTTGLLWESR